MSRSLWLDTVLAPHAQLTQDICADVAILGGGLAGLQTAYALTAAGKKVVVLEADHFLHGVSGHTTAKVTAQHGAIYQKLLRKWGPAVAQAYWQLNQQAILDIRRIQEEVNVDCDWQPQSAFLYATTPGDVKTLQREQIALTQIGVSTRLMDNQGLPLPVLQELELPEQASFHPLRYGAALLQALELAGCGLYEHSRVIRLEEGTVHTDAGLVQAPWVIMATHFPILNHPGYYFARMKQQRSHLMAVLGPRMTGMHRDVQPKGYSFRMQQKLLLVGSDDYRTGTKGHRAHAEALERFVYQAYPGADIIRCWSAQDCMTFDDLPYIGVYSRKTPRLLVATGFAKWGMTLSQVAARVLTGLVLGREVEGSAFLSPQRSLGPAMGGLVANGTAQAGHFAVSAVQPRCPTCTHMGCKTQYNAEEGTWDCPCHGSRFDREGQVLEGPALQNLKTIP